MVSHLQLLLVLVLGDECLTDEGGKNLKVTGAAGKTGALHIESSTVHSMFG